MERPSAALRLVTVNVEAVVDAIGEEATRDAETYVYALATRGYVPVPIPWEDGPIARTGEIDLLILGRNEAPVPPPGRALLRAIAFIEAAFHVGRAIGEPGDAQKERIVDIADGLEKLTASERSVLGAHYHHALRTPQVRPRKMRLTEHDIVARDRIIRSLYAAVTADGTLYDVVIERLEDLLNGEGLDGRRAVSKLIPPRQPVMRFARPEHDPSRWSGLDEQDGRLLSWIVARPRAGAADLEGRARMLGLEPMEALMRIRRWVDAEPALGLGAENAQALPAPDRDQRP